MRRSLFVVLFAASIISLIGVINSIKTERAVAQGGSISGRVYESDGIIPIAGADVWAAADVWTAGLDDEYMHPADWLHAITQADGSYTIHGLESSHYRVKAIAKDHAWEFYQEKQTYWDADLVAVTAPMDTSGIDFTLGPAGSISGHVYEQDGITPVAGACIDVSSTAPEWNWLAGMCCTGADGSYTIPDVPVGDFYAVTRANCEGAQPDLLDEWYAEGGSTPDGNQADPIQVLVGQTTTGIDFALDQAAIITGQVYDDGGGYVTGACVSAYRNACGMQPAQHFCCTDASGRYTLRGLTPDEYYLRTHVTCRCNSDPQADEWYTAQNGTGDCVAAEMISVELGTALEGFDFHLPLRDPPAPAPPTPDPAPTPFATPIARQSYRMEYGVRTSEDWCRMWLPVPRYWDGNGTWRVELGDISPPPTDFYQEANGTQIAYWELQSGEAITVTEVFTVEISLGVVYDLNETMEWPPYDTASELYQKNTRPTQWVQADHPLIIQQAQQIVGAETNPYRMAQAIHYWVYTEIRVGEVVGGDALSTLVSRKGNCGEHANLFVALCRAVGIPARTVGGFIPDSEGVFRPEYAHAWSEFYLPDYGWVQNDATGLGFPGVYEHGLALSKGNDIELGHEFPCGPLPWLQLPHVDTLNTVFPPCQDHGQGVWLKVEPLPSWQIYLPLITRE